VKLASLSPKSKLFLKISAWIVSLFAGWLLLGWMFSTLVVVDFVLNASPRVSLKGVNILMLGLDDTQDTQRSDTIMVAHLDMKTQRISVLSIPRDTKMKVPGLGETKINHAYAFGKEKLAKQAVSDLLGIPIHHAVVLRLSGVEAIIDALGGLDVVITKRMNYDDNAGKLHIHFQPGEQHLNGKEAISYLRFRHDEQADIGRIERQQSFVKSMLHKMVYTGQLLKLPFLAKTMMEHTSTDMSLREMVSLSLAIKKALEYGQIKTFTLPGVPEDSKNASYWIADATQTETLLQSWRTLSAAPTPVPSSSTPQVAEAEASLPKVPPKPLGLKVEVLNGYGQAGVANKVAELFGEFGLKVTRVGNAGSNRYDQTLIVDWRGQGTPILALARRLSIDPSRIIVYDKPEKPIDATIVLGRDWPQIEAKIRSEN
jgi:LCP family protein required for cell wall assembly